MQPTLLSYSPPQKRTQFVRTFDSPNFYRLDSNKGSQIRTDSSGNQTRAFHPSYTGIASATLRIYKSKEYKNESILPDVPATMLIKNKVTENLVNS